MSAQLPYLDRFVEAAARKVGLPYIWGGCGPQGYDCSGLVKACLLEVGSVDRRADWNSQRMFDELERRAPGNPAVCLAFFGSDPKAIHHVCICLEGDCEGWVIESAGGDQTTTQPTAGARVYIHRGAFWGAHNCQGYRIIPGPVAV